MRKVLGVGQNNWRFSFYRYKDSNYYVPSVIGLIFLISFFLIFYVIVPQLSNWFSIKNEAIATRKRIDIIKGNINFMNNLDRSVVNSQFDIVTSALPASREFTSILDVISEAALNAGVSVDDYSFVLGKLSAEYNDDIGEDGAGVVVNNDELLPITLQVTIGGDAQGTMLFLQQLSKKIPLSGVIEVEKNFTNATLDIEFYYKPIPDIVFEDDKPIEPVSDEQKRLISEISGWKPIFSSEDFVTTPTGSSSSAPLF